MDAYIREQSKIAYTRMAVGATLGFLIFNLPTAFLLWRDGWFHSVPCFTPPPGLILISMGTIGAVVGALLSLFSKKWKKEDEWSDGSTSLDSRKLPKIIIGSLVLPYVTIILIAVAVMLRPWASTGPIIIWLPLATVILSGVAMGMDTIKIHKDSPCSHKVINFLLSFVFTTVLQFVVAILFFMQTIYVYVGIKH